MTTTLRPAGPEERGANGVRSRSFSVCVNSRPVGATVLATEERFGAVVGRIVALAIDEPDRRRGRGTVAALAAEEVLRGWGCRCVLTAVPEGADVALRLATALGYVERNRVMLKHLDGTSSALPEDGTVRPTVRPMGQEEYVHWHAQRRAGDIQIRMDAGLPHDQAVAEADAYYRRTLPDGVHTAGMALRVLVRDGADLGALWLRLRESADAPAPAWVDAVEVAEEHRGRGHGHTLMAAAERECLAAGVRTIGLDVFADNVPALRLYASLGYRTTSRCLAKELI